MTDLTHDDILTIANAQQAKGDLRQTEAAFHQVRDELFAIIEGSPVDGVAIREQAYAGLHILKRVQTALFVIASGEEVANNSGLIARILAGEDMPDGEG